MNLKLFPKFLKRYQFLKDIIFNQLNLIHVDSKDSNPRSSILLLSFQPASVHLACDFSSNPKELVYLVQDCGSPEAGLKRSMFAGVPNSISGW